MLSFLFVRVHNRFPFVFINLFLNNRIILFNTILGLALLARRSRTFDDSVHNRSIWLNELLHYFLDLNNFSL